jgi:hypothetical protein
MAATLHSGEFFALLCGGTERGRTGPVGEESIALHGTEETERRKGRWKSGKMEGAHAKRPRGQEIEAPRSRIYGVNLSSLNA